MDSNIEQFYEEASERRREDIVRAFGIQPDSAFDADDLAKPIKPFPKRPPGQDYFEYREMEYLYYQEHLAVRWDLYLTNIEREIIKQFDYGGIAGVVNLANSGWFTIPDEIVQYDLYDIESNTGMRALLDIGIPSDQAAQSIAASLESAAWRQALEAGQGLKGVVDRDVIDLVNQAMFRSRTDPGFGRPRVS